MSLNASTGEMSAALKTLREQWEQVRELWRDGVAEEFENTFWKTLESQVAGAVKAMDRLSPVAGEGPGRDCD